ncbi:hypothetical protein MNEG_3946 [Monoraphidium neglectum]|uniref:Protein kinase domain-containing protein n=1 Tax=Monoraphidium neglectum TaxID=145388 RepID=A0A0D2JZT3_9CHLO|nr:hypothetical protein MNEG_3946 [Monoraphidium neglectum]KIZ04008.1 hypothetical protein MNEG_3946 [Monoraphidium neglectum]|eukprot:XP_013903027.1 hypothetical protein MNEG_3946 [Monoraphidium neglectum]
MTDEDHVQTAPHSAVVLARQPKRWYRNGDVLYESGDTKVFVTQLDGHLYVVKSLVLRAPPKGNIWLSSNLPWISELVKREIAVHRRVRSPYIPALLAVSKGKRHTDLVYEYGGADITYFISADGSWRGRERNLELSKAATRAMLDVLAACEKEGRCHTNLNPQKLLIAKPPPPATRWCRPEPLHVSVTGVAAALPFGHVCNPCFETLPPEAWAAGLQPDGRTFDARCAAAATGPAFHVYSMGVTAAALALGRNPLVPTRGEVEAEAAAAAAAAAGDGEPMPATADGDCLGIRELMVFERALHGLLAPFGGGKLRLQELPLRRWQERPRLYWQ